MRDDRWRPPPAPCVVRPDVSNLRADRCSVMLQPEGIVPVRSVAIASDASVLVAGTNSAHVHVWQPPQAPKADDAAAPPSADPLTPARASAQYDKLATFEAHSEDTYLLKVVISPDAQSIATTASDNTVRMWRRNGRVWELDQVLAQHQRWVWDACFSADSAYLVTASSDHTALLWDLASGEVIRHYTGHSLALTSVALNDSSRP